MTRTATTAVQGMEIPKERPRVSLQLHFSDGSAVGLHVGCWTMDVCTVGVFAVDVFTLAVDVFTADVFTVGEGCGVVLAVDLMDDIVFEVVGVCVPMWMEEVVVGECV